MATKIGIIGDGNVGGALARGFKRVGSEARAVGKDPAAIREAASWAEVVLLAVPFGAIDDVVKVAGDAVAGKTVVDVTNAFVAADDAAAKQTVLGLARSIGFDGVDAGPLKSARQLEPLAFFNIQLGYVLGMGTQIGFNLLHG